MTKRIDAKAAARGLMQATLASALAMFAAAASAQPGYLTTTDGAPVRDPYGLCWHTSDRTAAQPWVPCDGASKAATSAPRPKPAPQAATPALQPAAPAAQPAAPVMQRLTLSSELLFDFDRAVLRPAGQSKLDELAGELKGAKVDHVAATGYAGRIGSESYNQNLSERRAQAVKDYLVQKGIDPQRAQTEGKGESDPVTGNECRNLGREWYGNAKLVACLQPDRRVEIEVRGTRQTVGLANTGS